MSESKPFVVSKSLIWQSYLKVKQNGGAAGVDEISLEEFDRNKKKNLYKIWNRLSSGSYFPPEVKGVEIPKKNGGIRVLGVPTVSDRIAQMAIKMLLEPKLEPIFDKDSYGYRPGKSAHDAIKVTRKRCWKYNWVLEFDIKGLFDNIPHGLLMKALKHHTDDKVILLYVKRWLTVPINKDGNSTMRDKGTPQGGVISPLLANLFMHYCFDKWVRRNLPNIEFCRYADDGVLHCNSEEEAWQVKNRLQERLKECGLEMHPSKTRIVHCIRGSQKAKSTNIKFDFLGFTFMPRAAKDREGNQFLSFLPGVSRSSLKSMGQKVKRWKIHLRTEVDLKTLSRQMNPVIRGWINYYSTFYRTALYPLWHLINRYLSKWIRRKFKKVKRQKKNAMHLLGKIANENKSLFAHWEQGLRPAAG